MKARDLEVFPCELLEIRTFIERHHYSHNVNGVKISFCFKVMYKDEIVGGVIYGCLSTTAWKRYSKEEKSVLELRRLVLVDEAERNSESFVVGKTLRYIKNNSSGIDIVVSYADPLYGHSGTIYRASNFEYLGVGSKDKGFKDPENGKVYHSRALRTRYKGEYKPFVKKLREKHEKGLLEEIELPGKHCYVYLFSREKFKKTINT